VIVFAVAITESERDLLVSALYLAEEHGADTEQTRPLRDLLEHAQREDELRLAIGAIAP
jgi:hypothetical protein